MRYPVNVLDVLPAHQRTSEAAVDQRLQQAYAAFFSGTPRREDCDIILADLAFYSGYYNTTSMETPADQVKYSEGRRDVFGRMVRYANMPLAELSELQKSVLALTS